MGCCFPKMLSPENLLNEKDGQLMFTYKTGGLTLIRGNMQQNLPGGTLFITDKKLIHYTKCFGCHRLDFRLNKLKELESSLMFGSNCQVTIPCCRGMPDSYIVFKSKFDGKYHSVGIKVKDSEETLKLIEKLVKKYKQRLNTIKEEASEKDGQKQKLDSTSSAASSSVVS